MKKRIPNKSIRCGIIILFLHILSVNMLQAQNTSYPVGAIPGTIDVSPAGAATYTIPIEVVPGTQGMQPNLSIVYNSMSGMGLLGMKWNLAGLSAITRCGQNNYYDNNIVATNFGGNSRFALDGERLLNVNGNYNANGTEYATEVENFTRIVSHGYTVPVALYIPESFTVYTDDGSVIEYGTTDSSRQIVSTTTYPHILAWYISKITDADGNYVTFSYGNKDGAIWIDEIQYTGNATAGITPYAKVKFNYTDLPETMGENTYFVGGYGVPQTKLLETITVSYKDTPIRMYKFTYNGVSGERTAHLAKILLLNNNANLNATTIDWGVNNPSVLSETINGLAAGKIVTGDFNGDGYADLLVYDVTSKGKGYKMYLYNTETNSYPQTPTISAPSEEYESGMLYAQDINGDGKEELIIGKNLAPAPNSLHLFTCYSLRNDVLTSVKTIYIINFHSIYFGDYDGDGITDFLFARRSIFGTTVNWSLTFLCSGNPDIPLFVDFQGEYAPATVIDIQVMDINGDRKDDIKVKFLGNTTIYSFNGSGFIPEGGDLNIKPYSYNPQYVFYGDVNGDGVTDILACSATTSFYDKWTLYTGKGVGNNYMEDEITNGLAALDNISSNCPRSEVMMVDINGDGKDDIIQGNDIGNDKTMFIILLSYGYANDKYYFAKKTITVSGKYYLTKNWHIGDFNGDGRLEILLKDSENANDSPKIISISQDANYEFVKCITDGVGKKIELSYNHKYFLSDRKYFLSVVNSLQVSNGIGIDINTFQYGYESPVSSWKRRIFLGFEKYVSINNQENIKNESLFTLDASKQILIPNKQTSYCGNDKTGEKIFNIELKSLDNNRFAFNYNTRETYDILSDTKTIISNTLNSEGRLITVNTKTYDGCTASNWLHSETNTYTYNTISLNNNSSQKKTVPAQVVTTQQYGISGTVITGTVTYNYSAAGNLNWLEQSNAAGAIKTTYENYTSTGVYGSKTLSAAGCDSRTETYEYDATRRFVTKITNPLGHISEFIYDVKTGNKLLETDPGNLTTTYLYDSFGNLTQINYPDGIQTNISVNWNTSTNPPNAKYYTKTTSTGKPELRVYYDILGREVCRLDDGYYYQTVYNNKGQVVKTSYPFDRFGAPDILWHEYTYDSYGRTLTEKAPNLKLSYASPFGSRKVTVTDELRATSSWKDYDALGRITTANDPGGTITYTYEITASKQQKTTINAADAPTTILSDQWGNRLSITDPDAGKITSTYNGFNELVSQTDARGNITNYQYDKLGRITQKQFVSPDAEKQTITYTYDIASGKGTGQIYQIKMNGAEAETFTYDNFSRLSEHKKVIEGSSYTHKYSYNSNGQLQKLTYPDNFAINYIYNTQTGNLVEIRHDSNNALIYKVHTRDKFNHPLRCEFGNGVVTDYLYDKLGQVTRIQTGHKNYAFIDNPCDKGVIVQPQELAYWVDSVLLNYRYAYNEKGLMTSRTESVVERYEQYKYDNLDRLTEVKSGYTGQASTTQKFSYQNNGNIQDISNVGYYSYFNPSHAVYKIEPANQNAISANECAVEYNSFNQPVQITEGDYKISFTYDAHQQRQTECFRKQGALWILNLHVSKDFEYRRFFGSGNYNYHYIYGDNGVVALMVGTEDMYYIHTDHIGSYCLITDADGQEADGNRFDPWGNPVGKASFSLTDRGFTGHAHYPELKIINMNGRLYDPVIGRFFSPDKYVANSSFTQDFNRYSYARNNPLMYTDPDGEFIWFAPLIAGIVMGAVQGAIQGVMVATQMGYTGGKWAACFFGGMGFGAILGGAAGIGGAALGQAIGVSGAIGGAVVGGAMGAPTGALTGLATGLMAGQKGTKLGQTVGWGALTGFITGFVGGGIMGGIQAEMAGANFWDGSFTFYDEVPNASSVPQNQSSKLAESYINSDVSKSYDKSLSILMKQEYGYEQGNFLNPITTKPGTNVGMDCNGNFVFKDGTVARGYTHGNFGKPPYEMHIASNRLYNIIDFKATAGHELTHALNMTSFASIGNTSPATWKLLSEGAASYYSYQVYWNAGRYEDAFNYSLRAAFYKPIWGTLLHY